ncbi:rod shape-determining protein MreB [Acetoanaerobium pronyense]|uniref:Cell shape-determining protein MreB n=1 Tax=Acetoanaerobium pronyense TaxID=1482736 RepID=A0ABS4KKU6_9FIRM|nr:rod shape-determining protein [Acetoanaerobium pronyense]MBP2027244.1 rod shape-determining protein MreB [Acetoanaerobium pronyense]
MGFSPDIGIDLGTASVLVYVKGKGIVLQEPSVVAIDTSTNKVLAVGEEAQKMLGRTPGNIVAIRPLKDGVISDYDVTEKMLKHFIEKVTGGVGLFKFFKPQIIVCVPSGVTEVEKRAVIDATMEAGAREVYLIEEPIAAAIGAGIEISQPNGSMVVDIGGGTSDVAVISLGGIVVSTSIKIAGDKFDEAIVKHMRKKHSILIGERTAEQIKMEIGSAYPRDKEVFMEVRGRNLVSGLPETIKVSSEETLEALRESVAQIADAVHYVLEKTPPELSADISDKGILMTGGGSLLWGLDKLIAKRTGIKVYIAEEAISCVAKGTGEALNSIKVLQRTSKKRY